MSILPVWFLRLLVTGLILWLLWALVISPWMYSTESMIKSHYWWMVP